MTEQTEIYKSLPDSLEQMEIKLEKANKEGESYGYYSLLALATKLRDMAVKLQEQSK